MDNFKTLTVWTDESEIKIQNEDYILIGYLITNSDTEEFSFLNKLTQARKRENCWDTLHGSDLNNKDYKKIALLKRWIKIFKLDPKVYFHTLLYKRDSGWINKFGFEKYFAHQCFFGLGNKMKKEGRYIETLFSEAKTINALFDRRRAHTAYMDSIDDSFTKKKIKRFNELEDVYEARIKKQLLNQARKGNLKLKFSFIASKCFIALQLCDCLLNITRARLSYERNGETNFRIGIWNEFFLDKLHRNLSDYKEEPDYNFFEVLK